MKKIFAANWKLFKSPTEARLYLKLFKNFAQQTTGEIIFFPSAVSLEATAELLRETEFKWGAQNCYSIAQGPYTGEISALHVKEMGGSYVLLGHSERRRMFGETDAMVADKLALVQQLGLIPMLCIGETLEERELKRTPQVLRSQLERGLTKADHSKSIIIAYEPVWAIGTGKVATPKQVSETHEDIFNVMKELGFEHRPILYGGSVKPENAAELIGQPHVNGFLVGGASLDVHSFIEIASV